MAFGILYSVVGQAGWTACVERLKKAPVRRRNVRFRGHDPEEKKKGKRKNAGRGVKRSVLRAAFYAFVPAFGKRGPEGQKNKTPYAAPCRMSDASL